MCLAIVGEQRFIDYRDPKLYGHLVSTHSLHLHYDQRAHLDERQESAMSMNQNANNSQNQSELGVPGTSTDSVQSPVFVENENRHRQMTTAEMTHIPNEPTSMPKNDTINHNEPYSLIFRQFTESDYDYSDSEEEEAEQPKYGITERREHSFHSVEMDLLMAKHNKFGNQSETDHNLELFDDPSGCDSRNKLCPYCLMVIWSEIHRKECLFMPKRVRY